MKYFQFHSILILNLIGKLKLLSFRKKGFISFQTKYHIPQKFSPLKRMKVVCLSSDSLWWYFILAFSFFRKLKPDAHSKFSISGLHFFQTLANTFSTEKFGLKKRSKLDIEGWFILFANMWKDFYLRTRYVGTSVHRQWLTEERVRHFWEMSTLDQIRAVNPGFLASFWLTSLAISQTRRRRQKVQKECPCLNEIRCVLGFIRSSLIIEVETIFVGFSVHKINVWVAFYQTIWVKF